MSLLLSHLTSPRDHYVAPSYGDMDFDPELTQDWISFIEEENHEQASSAVVAPEMLINILSNHDLPLPKLASSGSIPKQKEYTTQEKIMQVHNGQHVLNALKSGRNIASEPQILSEPEVRQAIQVNYKKQNDGILEMVNQLQLKKQKQVLGFLLKQFGSALFTGKSVMNVSLPVSIFEAQSHLEREARSMSYAPHFLEKGGNTNNILEQFKLSTAHFISSLHLGTNPQKPFNPIVGETFQGKIGDYPIYVEQISHHPPAAALQLLGKNFTVEGQTEFTAAISMNSVKSCKVGFLKVTYNNTKTVIRAHYPAGLMSGTAFGKRSFQFTDKFYIFDIENKHYAEISFDNTESSLFKKTKGSKDQFYGGIWKINNAFVEKLKKVVKSPHDLADLRFKEKDHAVSKLANIEGSWLESLKIGDQVYWNFGEILPYKLQYVQNSLPSDSNYRLDVLYMRAEDEVKSQRYKEIVEEGQRNDRKLRENYKKKNMK